MTVTNPILVNYPALGYPLYRRYWFASFASVGATQLVTLAQGWLVFKLTGSALDLGVLGAAASVPNILVSLFGGALADRFDKRKILLVTSLLTAALMFLLAALDVSDIVTVWHVWVIAGLTAIITGVEWPTRQSIFPHLIERPGLMSAVALNSVLWQATRMIVPAIGGVLIAVTDTWFLFALAGGGFVVMFAVMARMQIALPGSRSGSTLSQVKQGLQYIAGNELFRWLIVLSYAGMFFISSYMQLMPAFAAHLGADETGYGMLISASGVGSVLGTLAVGRLQRLRALGYVLLGAAAASAIALYAFAVASGLGWFVLALATALGIAVCTSVFMICAMTVMQLEVPDALRGRVMGIHTITYSLMPLGGLMLGAIATASSIGTAVVVGASVFLLITIAIGILQPVIRRLDSGAFER